MVHGTEGNTSGLNKDNYAQIKRALQALKDTRDIINSEKKSRNKISYAVERNNFNNEVNICYKRIKFAISNKKKARLLISKINKEPTPHSLLYLLLYIISIKEKELEYGYEDLFENDGGVPILERVNKKKADFELFGTYHYERSAFQKAIASIRLFDKK